MLQILNSDIESKHIPKFTLALKERSMKPWNPEKPAHRFQTKTKHQNTGKTETPGKPLWPATDARSQQAQKPSIQPTTHTQKILV